jgi:tetratricopeptide (TPR) repeat protein
MSRPLDLSILRLPARPAALLIPFIAALLAFPATAAEPPAPAATLDSARARAAAGDLAPLEAFVGAHPEDREATRLLADDEAVAGRFDDAEALYRALLRTAPGDKSTHDRLGRLYASRDRLDDAVAEFEASLPDVVAYSDLVTLHRRRGDLAAFVDSYRSKAYAAPFDASLQFGYGVILRRIHRPQEALDRLTTAAYLSPRTCAILDEIGNAQLDLGRNTEAIASFESCLRLEPNDYSALVDEGVARLDDAPALARSEFDRAATLRPNRPEAYVDLGYIEDAANHPQAAAEFYDRALALDPYFRDAYVNLGYNYFANGRLQLAEETFLRGLGVSHDDGRIEYLLGETLAKRGKTNLAGQAYRIATSSDEPEVVEAAKAKLATI